MVTLKSIKINNGVTLNCYGVAVEYKTGFQVSKKDLYTIASYKLTKRLINEILTSLGAEECLGIWIDDNKAYIDISERIKNYNHALKVGRERKQISVWGWKKGEAIYC